MKFRFSIGRKISLGFSIIILSTIAVFILTDTTLKDSIHINTRINDVTNPSVSSLEQLKLLTVRSKMLIQNWVNYQRSPEDDPDKIQLIDLSDTEFPELKEHNYIDTLIHRKLRKLRIAPSGICTDEEFLRRATLDITGTLPTVEEYKNFIDAKDPKKREKLVDDLIGRKEFVEMCATARRMIAGGAVPD